MIPCVGGDWLLSMMEGGGKDCVVWCDASKLVLDVCVEIDGYIVEDCMVEGR